MRCYIGIGSNLGDRQKNIEKAIEQLRHREGIEVIKVSNIYETEPVGGPPEQPKYLNGVLEIETSLEPMALLRVMQDTERELGRKRVLKWGPRVIDLDILTYGDRVIDEPELKIPHPLMGRRDFVQRPLNDIKELAS